MAAMTLIPISYMDKIRKIRGVTSVKERLWGNYYDPISGANYTIMASDDARVTPGKIIIGEGVSRTRLLFEGDAMEFRAHDGNIVSLRSAGHSLGNLHWCPPISS